MKEENEKLDTVAVIFARGGSRGIPGKNLKDFAGKPLIGWAIEQTITSGVARRVLVSTDDEQIATVANSFGAETPFIRPASLASDDSPEILSWRHALEFLAKDEGCYPSALLSVPSCRFALAGRRGFALAGRRPKDARRAATAAIRTAVR